MTLGRFAPVKFTKNLVMAKTKEYLKALLDPFGPVRLALMVDTQTDLLSLMAPDIQQAMLAQLKPFAWAVSLINDDDLYVCWPDWAQKVLQEKGQAGVEWSARQLRFIRSVTAT